MRVFRDAADIQSYAAQVIEFFEPGDTNSLEDALIAIANGVVNAELHDTFKPTDSGEHDGKVTIQVQRG